MVLTEYSWWITRYWPNIYSVYALVSCTMYLIFVWWCCGVGHRLNNIHWVWLLLSQRMYPILSDCSVGFSGLWMTAYQIISEWSCGIWWTQHLVNASSGCAVGFARKYANISHFWLGMWHNMCWVLASVCFIGYWILGMKWIRIVEVLINEAICWPYGSLYAVYRLCPVGGKVIWYLH
jgi:hypothetical protein